MSMSTSRWLAVAALFLSSTHQTSPCRFTPLKGSSAERQALIVLKAVVAAQGRHLAQNGRFFGSDDAPTLTELGGVSIESQLPRGWEMRILTTGAAFTASASDPTDPCGVTIWTDERGLIVVGETIE